MFTQKTVILNCNNISQYYGARDLKESTDPKPLNVFQALMFGGKNVLNCFVNHFTMQLFIWQMYNIYTLQKQAPFIQIYKLKKYIIKSLFL